MKLDIQLFASGTITKTSGPSVGDIRILWESTVNNNEITITATLQMRKTSGYMFGTFSGSINIAGQSGSISMYRPESAPWNTTWKDVGTVTKTITNITGTDYAISGTVSNTGTGMAGTYTASGTAVITDIYSILSYPDNSTRFNIESTFNIRFTKYVSTYYQKLVVKYGNTTIKTINGINDNASFTFTSSELNTIYGLMSSVVEGTFTFVLYTYTDSGMSTLIGSDTKTPTGYISNANPTAASATYQDTNTTTTSLTNNNTIGVKGYSNIKITITNHATGNKGATISYYLFPDGQTENYATNVSHTINNYNLTSLYVTAYDSRGNYTTTPITYNYVNYRTPVINSLVVERKDGVEEETYLGISANLWEQSYAAGRNNDITYFGYRYKETSSSSWSNWIDRTSNFKTFISGQSLNNISVPISSQYKIYTNVSGQTGFTQGTQYDIQVRIADGYSSTIFNSAYESSVLDDGTVLDSYNKTSTGYQYGINGLVDETKSDGLQVNGNEYITGDNETNGSTKSTRGFYSYGTGNVGTPIGSSNLVIKRASQSADSTPNNGVVLEFGNSTSRAGQLYIGDNATQGIYYNGWSNGTRGSWRRLADVPRTLYNNDTGTNGDVVLSDSVANYSYIEIFFKDNNGIYGGYSKLTNINGKTFDIGMVEAGASTTYIRRARYTANGDTLTLSNKGFVAWSPNTQTNYTTNYIYIIKVLGYY